MIVHNVCKIRFIFFIVPKVIKCLINFYLILRYKEYHKSPRFLILLWLKYYLFFLVQLIYIYIYIYENKEKLVEKKIKIDMKNK